MGPGAADQGGASAATPQSPIAPARSRRGLLEGSPWAAVCFLTLIGAINYLDRTLPMILAEPLKQDLGLSDTALGFLNGFGFTFVYALAGIPIARMADRGRYGLIISCALGFWSLMTALGSLATSGLTLALTRLGVAVGEAGNTPAAHAFISRRFDPGSRAAALAVLTTATAFGTMLGLTGGGFLEEHLGWRGTMLFMGALGLLLAPLALLMLGKGEPITNERAPTVGELGTSLRQPAVVWMMIAFCFMSMAAYSLGAFGPSFLIRIHGLSVGEAGLRLGVLNGVTGIAALLLTGWLSARLHRRDRRWGLGILVLLILVSIPISTIAFRTGEAELSALLTGLSYGVMASYMALTVATLHAIMPITMRAQASATLLLCSGVVGGLGPLLTGMISDRMEPVIGVHALGIGMLIIPACLGAGALAYVFAILNLPPEFKSSVKD